MQKLTETQTEMLQDLLTSPGWPIFVDMVLERRQRNIVTVLERLRSGPDAQYITGVVDGAFETIELLYRALGEKPAPQIGVIIRNRNGI